MPERFESTKRMPTGQDWADSFWKAMLIFFILYLHFASAHHVV